MLERREETCELDQEKNKKDIKRSACEQATMRRCNRGIKQRDGLLYLRLIPPSFHRPLLSTLTSSSPPGNTQICPFFALLFDLSVQHKERLFSPSLSLLALPFHHINNDTNTNKREMNNGK